MVILGYRQGGDGTVNYRRTKRLSEAVNRELIEAAQKGDEAAETRLVVASSGLVYNTAVRYKKKHEHEASEDLFQIGMIGLVKAIRKFDLNSGYKFTTYAVPTVDGEIRKYLRDKANLIKVPRDINVAAQKIHKFDMYETEVEGIMTTLGIDRQTALMAQQFAKYQVASLDEPIAVKEGAEQVTLMDQVEDANGKDWFEEVAIREAFKVLDDREKTVIEMRFFKDHKQSEIAGILGVSQVHVSRIERKAISKLKDQLIEI
jgi:RNA polymerase sporulation-specific sigma factor